MPEDNFCGLLIKQISDALGKRANNALRGQELTMAQVTVLRRLDETPSKQATLKELEQFLKVAQSTAAGIVMRLEQKGYVVSVEDCADKRVKIAQLTPRGEQCCHRAKEDMDDTEKRLVSGLTEAERHALLSMLQKLSDNVK